MAITGGLILGAASYSQQRKAAKASRRAAEDARIAGAAQSAANRQAAEAASERDRVAREAAANQELAADQLDDSADVTIADPTSESARRRQVRAQFNVGDAGASGVGSIRL